MPVPGLTTLVLAATRLVYHLAEKRRWLPGGAYHRLSVDRLKSGDLDEAERLNRLALQRKPTHGKALVVRDLIAMRRDAATAALLGRVAEEKAKISALQEERLAFRRELARSGRRLRRSRLLTWLLVPAAAVAALASGFAISQAGLPPLSRILAGLLGVALVLVLVLLRFTGGQRRTEAALRDQEYRAALVTLSREIETRVRRTSELERRINAIAQYPGRPDRSKDS
jgi:hypothetical protein